MVGYCDCKNIFLRDGGHTHLTKYKHLVLQVWSCSILRAQGLSAQHLEGVQEV